MQLCDDMCTGLFVSAPRSIRAESALRLFPPANLLNDGVMCAPALLLFYVVVIIIYNYINSNISDHLLSPSFLRPC